MIQNSFSFFVFGDTNRGPITLNTNPITLNRILVPFRDRVKEFCLDQNEFSFVKPTLE